MSFHAPASSTIPEERETRGIKQSPRYILIITVAGIALAEIIAMIVIYFFRTTIPYYQQVLLDAAVMTVIIFPLLYFLTTRPLLQYIEQQKKTENVLESRLRLIEYAHTHSLDELLQETLDEVEALTGSQIGFFHFLEPDQRNIWLRAWSTNTIRNMCTLDSKGSHYDLNLAGVWADCVRERRPVIHNDYASLPHRKGLPEGHAPVQREMSVPIMQDGNVVAILGMGNKEKDYTEADVEIVMTFADFAWDIIKDKQVEYALRASEEKFRTLVDWTYDWELWLDPQGHVIYNSPSCERITGYMQDEFVDDPGLMEHIIHVDDRETFRKHMQLLHSAEGGLEIVEYRLLARDGSEHWIEHVCRPLFAEEGHYLGRRISNRDITERKQIEKEIQEQNQKEKMLTQTLHTIQLDIARDLHDTIGQNISFLRMKLDYLSGKKTMKHAEIKNEIQTMTKAANESYDLLRGTLSILQSIDSADLYRLFTRYIEQVQERSKFTIDYSTHGDVKPLAAPRMRQLFYVFREILSNIEKHAGATQVSVEVVWDHDSFNLLVRDNGLGFDKNEVQFGGHYGLKFMRDRVDLLNGTLKINSASGSGTQVSVRVPYEAR